MAQRSKIEVAIGGTLTVGQVEAICRLANETGLRPTDGCDLAERHFEGANERGPLVLTWDDAPGGEATTLEAYCQGEGIAFSRQTQGYPGEWLPERVVFDGSGVADSYEMNEEGNPVVGADEVAELGTYDAIAAVLAAARRPTPPVKLDRRLPQPEAGVTYDPGPDIVRASLGLPRHVDRIETRPGLDVFVVQFTTDEGTGFCSGNVWHEWIKETRAKPRRQLAL